MSFRVDSGAVDSMANMMGRVCDAARLFHTHALTGSENAGEGTLLTLVFEVLDKYQDFADVNLERGWRLAGACSETLAKAAKYYQQTEDSVAAAADATLPEPIQPPRTFLMQYNPPWRAFNDVYDAAEDPRKPGCEYAGTALPNDGSPVIEITGVVEEILGKISVPPHVRDLVRSATGTDWIETITRHVGGNWAELIRRGMALRDISVAYGRISANVMRGWGDLGPRWCGNAAGIARDWLWDYARNASLFSGFCDQAGVAVQNFVRSAYHGMQALSVAVDWLLDALTDVPLRAPAPDLVAGTSADASKMRDALDLIEAAVHAFEAVPAFRESNAMAWPTIDYSHPAVT